jgi:hypothetical protein
MSEIKEAVLGETVKAVEDKPNQVTLRISRGKSGQSLDIFIKAPVLAEVVRAMASGNYGKADYAEIYKSILVDLPENKARVITKPGIAKITKNFISGADFAWDAPRAILIANPEKLAEGFTLTYKMDQPVAPDQLRKWGKMFNDGCKDIISNARPFTMSWVLDEVPVPAGA